MSSYFDLVKREEPLPSQGNSDDKSTLAALTKKVNAQKDALSTKIAEEEAHLRDILNDLLPPRVYTDEESKEWVQYTSTKPATREEVLSLQEQLDDALRERQARESNLCAVREDLYSQTFDELIRQVTIRCPERGLMLLRVRDEIRLTISAYQTLYETSVAFGQRKSVETENQIVEAKMSTKFLEETVEHLRGKVRDIQDRIDIITQNQQRILENQRSEQAQEIGRLKEQRVHLERFCASSGVDLNAPVQVTDPNKEEGNDSSSPTSNIMSDQISNTDTTTEEATEEKKNAVEK